MKLSPNMENALMYARRGDMRGFKLGDLVDNRTRRALTGRGLVTSAGWLTDDGEKFRAAALEKWNRKP